MEKLHELIKSSIFELIEHASHHEFALIILSLLAAFGILGQFVLYYKCNLPGVASIVPIWNVIVFLKIMGRPAWQSIFVIFPPPIMAYIIWTGDVSMAANITFILSAVIFFVFAVIVYIELCKCFGKRSIVSYLLVLLFNGFYVMYLGMSGETEYQGPLYGPKAQAKVA
ncbi:MAG: hypothetical protein CL840_09260 [Crocinitomicaceae bacterium]|nr:hypothetical protein [Crocinitomicaceae bacterium]|tara:strand:- start:24249 stop:24755 length:507 start_codon:yes stop_codon:yes gene_type:complete